MDKFSGLWEHLRETYHCPIIQNNFEYPFFRLMGNKDASDMHGRVNFVTRLNCRFYEYAQGREDFYICDINYLSASYGLEKWSDPYYWHMYKYAVAVPAIPYLSFNISNIIKSIYGKNKKVLNLDLDNTLWGGIVGDESKAGFGNYEDYLKSLEMKGEIQEFAPLYLSRIAQLTNKSNQFNLTTKRYAQSDIEAVAKDSDRITLYGKLGDRFGDNGVVSIVIGKIAGRKRDELGNTIHHRKNVELTGMSDD